MSDIIDMKPGDAIGVYVASLQPTCETGLKEADGFWTSLEKIKKIESKEVYELLGETAREAKEKWKFLDDERKVSVTPLNEEVKRINAWYKPALEKLKAVSDRCEAMMGVYVLEQRRKERELLEKARIEAQKVIATNADPQVALSTATSSLVQAAAEVAPPKLDKTSDKPTWNYEITDPLLLVTKHPELAMPDPKKVKAWVAEYDGKKPVPAGMKIEEAVKVTVRR